MPLLFPTPFPNESATNSLELFRFGRAQWLTLQKLRGGQFVLATTIPASTVERITYVDPTDAGVDNLKVGMWVSVSPPATINASLQLDYAYCPAPGQLTVQVRNLTAAPIVLSGTWSYVGFCF